MSLDFFDLPARAQDIERGVSNWRPASAAPTGVEVSARVVW